MKLILLSIPSSYLNSVFAAWLAELHLRRGRIFNPIKEFRALKPIFVAFGIGVLPGAILSQILIFFAPSFLLFASIPAILGAVVTGIYLHRELLGKVNRRKNWNIAIATLATLLTLVSVWISSLLPEIGFK